MFAVNTAPDASFIGSTVLQQRMQHPFTEDAESTKGASRRRVLLQVQPDEELPLLLHDEPVYHHDKLIGSTTSGGIGFRTSMALSMAYIDKELSAGDNLLSIDVAGVRLSASILSAPPYDPSGMRMRHTPT